MSLDVNEQLPENFEWYKNQIAGHHPSIICNGKRQIGVTYLEIFLNFLFRNY